MEQVVQAAIGGQAVTQVYEGDKHFDLTIRWQEPYRASVESIREVTAATPDGSNIPLGQVADVRLEDGPTVVYREDGRRYVPVKFSVRGRDLASTIEEAQRKIRENVKLPYDTHLEWAGEINELKDAMGRLTLIIPLTLVLIGFLVYSAVRTWIDTLIVIVSIPVACTGGVLALMLTGVHFSVSAAAPDGGDHVDPWRVALVVAWGAISFDSSLRSRLTLRPGPSSGLPCCSSC